MKLLLMMVALFGSWDSSAGMMRDTLARLGKSVERFWTQFPAVTCDEVVSQAKLGNRGKVLYSEQSVFDYLISLNFNGTDMAVEESRVLKKKSGNAQNLPLLVSNGFPTLLLVFHPYFQDSFEYTRLDDEIVDGRTMLRIHFRHIRGTRSTSVLRLRGSDYPLELEGTAWIDPDSMAITRVMAGLVAPMEDLGLKALNSDVRYAPVEFTATKEAEWLPATATVEVETAAQHWRNTHRFVDYKQFSVRTESRIQK